MKFTSEDNAKLVIEDIDVRDGDYGKYAIFTIANDESYMQGGRDGKFIEKVFHFRVYCSGNTLRNTCKLEVGDKIGGVFCVETKENNGNTYINMRTIKLWLRTDQGEPAPQEPERGEEISF